MENATILLIRRYKNLRHYPPKHLYGLSSLISHPIKFYISFYRFTVHPDINALRLPTDTLIYYNRKY
jgi:hypothetical protein